MFIYWNLHDVNKHNVFQHFLFRSIFVLINTNYLGQIIKKGWIFSDLEKKMGNLPPFL